MTPDNAKIHDEAVEALIVASLREPVKEGELTHDDISRYVDQRITLSEDDDAALEKSKAGLMKTIGEILESADHHEPDRLVSTAPVKPPEHPVSTGPTRAREEFIEAVVISHLTNLLATPQYPLGRLRYNKLAYLSHRKAEEDVTQHYLKKAAGPYSPWAKYQGPERIAVKNGYVRYVKAGNRQGLLPGQNIANIDKYVAKYPVCSAINWVVDHFRYRKNDELELLATVDFAVIDLFKANIPISATAVRDIIATNPEWAPKLNRTIFSDENIARSLGELKTIFPKTYR